MKKKIIAYLDNQTSFFSFDYVSDVFTASKIAEIFNVKRNTISHYLNQLTSEGKLIKVNSRPVFYLSKKTFEEENFKLKKNVYSSFQEILNEKPYFKKERDFFSLMIGYNQSLNRAIDQIKMSLAYPNNGLPVLITGESGTGKSYLVKLVYEYCIENDILKEDAPFITLNCAQYANNPELLTSNLFGYVKGAFTGANETQQGIFESANEGILFLDEVHRLNAEAQEKLFTYLDQHIIYRVGDNSHPLHINTRLFFATTEDLESNFLTTFIRRIPIQITLPSIKERSRNERIELIYSFFISERHIIQKDISISSQVINLLAGNHFKGNIGELKNCVKVTVAKAFMEQKSEQVVNISIHYLPSYLLRDTEQLVYNIDENKILIKSDTTLQQMIKI
ncbi:sigma 54-interacting transcriptional regulator, partial [Vagococcus teuberi]